MSEQVARLRQLAASHRLKAMTGQVATAAARDLHHLVTQAMEGAVERGLDDGTLRARWEKALADAAENVGPDPSPVEVQLAALVDVLAWLRAVAKRTASDYAEKIEGDRRAVEGRAAGIEEALALLSPQTGEELSDGERALRQG